MFLLSLLNLNQSLAYILQYILVIINNILIYEFSQIRTKLRDQFIPILFSGSVTILQNPVINLTDKMRSPFQHKFF